MQKFIVDDIAQVKGLMVKITALCGTKVTFIDENGKTGSAKPEDLQPVMISPEVLEVFKFNEGVLGDIDQPMWSKFWQGDNNQQVSVETWPKEYQDTNSTTWMVRINSPYNNLNCEVHAIHEIQHCAMSSNLNDNIFELPVT